MARRRNQWIVSLIGLVTLAAPTLTSGPAATVRADGLRPDAVILGDSLTGGNATYIGPYLRSHGLTNIRVEGLSSRRITVSFHELGYRDSGIERIGRLKAEGIVPKLWVVQLGTNDLTSIQRCECPDPVVFAGTLIDQLTAAIGPNTPIAWVTVLDRGDYERTNWFNEALRRRAATNPYFRLIDWSGRAMQHPDWFLDRVHQNTLGVQEFSRMYVEEITPLLAQLPGSSTPPPGMQPAQRLGHPTDPGIVRP